ncbi:DUF6612 family protein [Solibacillus sp. CAU 1738]|uniref:DUF6612 family protein n=1 Tax=Solibacillus sp. CAU 1738 TaxID=3140363 RepID=UPI0032606E13
MKKKILLFIVVLLLAACSEEVTEQKTKLKNEQQSSKPNTNTITQYVGENLQAEDIINEALARRQKITSIQGHMLLEDYLEVDFVEGMNIMLMSSSVDMQATNIPLETLYLMNTHQEVNEEISNAQTYVYLKEDNGQKYNAQNKMWEPLPKDSVRNFHNVAREDLDVTKHLQEILKNADKIDIVEKENMYLIVFDVVNTMDDAYIKDVSPITQGIWQYIEPSYIDADSLVYTEAIYEVMINMETFDVESLNIFVKIEGTTVNGELVKHSASNQSQFSSFNELKQIDLPEGVWQLN